MASVDDTLKQINSSLRSASEPYSEYSCKTVSWDDVQRGTVGGGLSCWGANITDTRLYAKDGRQLFTVRGDNWDERLGKVTSDDIALVASDDGGGGMKLRPFSLRSVLADPSRFGGYAGISAASLADDVLDREVSVRFQTTFLPVDATDKAVLEFAPQAYNYNTRNDEDPRNLILLCTTQGTAFQQDGSGAKNLYHHAKVGGEVMRYWLEAESSNHKVGGSQVESTEEKDDALRRGKATSAVIGVRSMETRFNVLMTIQVPLKQKQKGETSCGCIEMFGDYDSDSSSWECSDEDEACESMDVFMNDSQPSTVKKELKVAKKRKGGIKFGKSSAARVSRGSCVDTWRGLTVKDPQRHPNEHVTVTIVMYYTCSGGVPTESDVRAAIDDLEELYQSVESGNLADAKFNFMKSELTVKDAIDVQTKLVTQPPPKPDAPMFSDTFPSSSQNWCEETLPRPHFS